MTYIKWKDEVESYLVNLSYDEKQKIFSYFSEMYADKRDAGKSEEQIIEEFGAPYDVAKKILSESREAAPPIDIDADGTGGGKELPRESTPKSAPTPPPTPAPANEKPKKDAGKVALGVIFTILLIPLSIFLIGAPIGGIVQGFAAVAAAVAGLIIGNGAAGMMVANIGFGLISVGASFMLLAPFSLLNKFLWNKLKAYSQGE